MSRAVDVWYIKLLPLSVRSWPDLKKTFLNQYLSRREGKAPIQYLQDMRQAIGKTLKNYLTRFINEIIYMNKLSIRRLFQS